jgi:hypothetical protein
LGGNLYPGGPPVAIIGQFSSPYWDCNTGPACQWRIVVDYGIVGWASLRGGPDYFSGNLNVGIPYLANLVGPTFAFNLDRNGNLYGGLGINVGKALSLVSGSITANWLNRRATPTRAQLQSFLTKNSFNLTAGYWAGVQFTWTPGVGTASGGGFVSPQVGVSWTYSWRIGNTGIKW